MQACTDRPIQLLVISIEPSRGEGWSIRAIHLHADETRPECIREVQHGLAEWELYEVVEGLVGLYRPDQVGGGYPPQSLFS